MLEPELSKEPSAELDRWTLEIEDSLLLGFWNFYYSVVSWSRGLITRVEDYSFHPRFLVKRVIRNPRHPRSVNVPPKFSFVDPRSRKNPSSNWCRISKNECQIRIYRKGPQKCGFSITFSLRKTEKFYGTHKLNS